MALARFERDFTDEAGNLLTGNVTVQVRRMTGGLPQLYSDRAGASALGNPFINDGGRVAFHAAGNAYRVTVTQGAFSRELTYVALGLAGETDFTFARNQGEWDDTATYARGDYVIHEGFGLFISTQDGNLNHEPDSTTPGSTEYWTYYPGVAGPPGEGLHFDIQVDELADRAAFDAEAAGFAVLVSDVGDGRAAIYVMGSGGSGDWGAAAYVTGPAGAGDVAEAADLAALGSTDTTLRTVVWLKEAAREGVFQWDPSDLSDEVTADTDEDRYVAPNSDPTGASGAWVRAGSVATGSYWEDDTPRARIHRLADRLMVGDAVENDGLPNGTGSWLYAQGAGASKMSWIERNAVIAGVTSTGSVGVTGAARNENDGAALGVIGFATTKPGGVSTAGAWGGYFEAVRANAASKAHGVEIDITNLLVSPITGGLNPYDPYVNGATRALWVASGGDVNVNPTTFPADVAIGVVNNGNTFNAGMVFGDTSLERDGGGTGRGHAIRMAYNHAVEWYESGTETLGFSIASQVSDATHKQELLASNSGLLLYSNTQVTFQVLYVASAVNYLRIEPSATGSSLGIRANGADTNINFALIPKGTGAVVPGASDGAALGTTALMWSDLFLASGGVLNFNAGDVTVTHAANALAFAGASSGYTFDSKVSIVGSAAFFNALEMQSTADDANAGPYFLFYRNSATPANNDTGGTMIWQFKNDGGSQFNAATLDARMLDVAAGSEDVALRFTVSVNGANNSTVMQLHNGVQIGSPTSGYMGAGTLNLDNDLYKDGVKVVGARDTGWTAMTGTPDESTAYATGSVTLPQLAGRVMALQAALTTHGLIGA